jgi:sigma-B regulation protein RsbU (phosphoserine phosphatase)
MSFQIENLEGELLRLIADQSSLPSFERFLAHVMIHAGVESYKLVWLDEQKNETEWLEHNYYYLFETKTVVLQYEKRDILVLYYNGNAMAPQTFAALQVAIIHVYLTTAYRTKNDRRYMRQDLELAAKMQQMLVPKNLYCNKSFCASGLYIPNYKVGGDFYDVIPINDHKVGFCIGDISGKGINAAILMAHFIGFIRSTLLQNKKLEEAIQLINAKMYELTEGEKFITLFLGVYNTEDGRLVYINSGHLPIPIYNAQGIEWLETGTTILGMFAELPFLELGKIKIESKKQLLLYTDGLLNMTIDHVPFLSNQELDFILHHECLGKSTHEITDYFREKVKGINVAEDLKDDISVLAVEVV